MAANHLAHSGRANIRRRMYNLQNHVGGKRLVNWGRGVKEAQKNYTAPTFFSASEFNITVGVCGKLNGSELRYAYTVTTSSVR